MANENSTPSARDIKELQIDIRKIREALLIGLESFGELERVIDQFQLLESCGRPASKELRPIHPTGAPDTIGVFAAALRLLELMEPEPA